MNNDRRILLIVTGGTILSETADPQSGTVPSLDIDAYLSKNAFLTEKATITVHRFDNIDSRLMTPEIWLALARSVTKLARQTDYSGIIILHGTDTLEETAFFLSLTLSLQKPIILTGAMRAADEYDSDGPRNLQQAIEVILSATNKYTGVMVVFNGHIYSPTYLFKTNTHLPNSFTASRTGHLGVIEHNAVKWFNQPQPYLNFPLPSYLSQVDLFFAYPGFKSQFISYAIQQGAKGIVIAGYGCGNLHDDLASVLAQILQQKIPVVMTTRVPEGSVFPLYGGPGGGIELHRSGIIYNHDLAPFKARILLMAALSVFGNDLDQIKICFEQKI